MRTYAKEAPLTRSQVIENSTSVLVFITPLKRILAVSHKLFEVSLPLQMAHMATSYMEAMADSPFLSTMEEFLTEADDILMAMAGTLDSLQQAAGISVREASDLIQALGLSELVNGNVSRFTELAAFRMMLLPTGPAALLQEEAELVVRFWLSSMQLTLVTDEIASVLVSSDLPAFQEAFSTIEALEHFSEQVASLPSQGIPRLQVAQKRCIATRLSTFPQAVRQLCDAEACETNVFAALDLSFCRVQANILAGQALYFTGDAPVSGQLVETEWLNPDPSGSDFDVFMQSITSASLNSLESDSLFSFSSVPLVADEVVTPDRFAASNRVIALTPPGAIEAVRDNAREFNCPPGRYGYDCVLTPVGAFSPGDGALHLW